MKQGSYSTERRENISDININVDVDVNADIDKNSNSYDDVGVDENSTSFGFGWDDDYWDDDCCLDICWSPSFEDDVTMNDQSFSSDDEEARGPRIHSGGSRFHRSLSEPGKAGSV